MDERIVIEQTEGRWRLMVSSTGEILESVSLTPLLGPLVRRAWAHDCGVSEREALDVIRDELTEHALTLLAAVTPAAAPSVGAREEGNER